MGRDSDDVAVVGAAGIGENVQSFVAHRHAFAAIVGVAIIITDGQPGAFVEGGLVAFPAGAVFAFVGTHGEGAKFDAVDYLPGFRLAGKDFNAVESGLLEHL